MGELAGPIFIIALGLVVFIAGLIAYWQRRGKGVYLSSVFLLVMAFGGLSISAFYYSVLEASLDGHDLPLTTISRFLWSFILLSTLLIITSVLSRRNEK